MYIASIKTWVGILFGCVGSFFAFLFGAHTWMMGILVSFMAMDFVTGLIVAGVFRKSQKTEGGAIESNTCLKGILRKGGMFLVVCIAAVLDILMDTNYITVAAIYFFIANELISLVENLGIMGVPWPETMVDAIEVLKKKSK